MADAATFIQVFPEFTSIPGASIAFWLGQAPNQLAICRLGANADMATYLFVAHNLALGQAANGAAGTIGQVPYPAASKAAGGLSVSYNTDLTASEGAGIYNATSYGQRLWKLLQASAVGGVYVSSARRGPFPLLGRCL